MKTIGLICVAITGAALSSAASAALSDSQAAQLSAKYNCQACHAIDKKLVGPAFKDVAKKYAGDGSAPQKLAQKVKTGGSGAWGAIPMPPNNVPDADLNALVAWVLGLK
jgi:cytochrome c